MLVHQILLLLNCLPSRCVVNLYGKETIDLPDECHLSPSSLILMDYLKTQLSIQAIEMSIMLSECNCLPQKFPSFLSIVHEAANMETHPSQSHPPCLASISSLYQVVPVYMKHQYFNPCLRFISARAQAYK